MSRTLTAVNASLVGHRVMLRLLYLARGWHTTAIAATRADARVRTSVAMAAHAHEYDSAMLDAVAGSEFVDDRIRLIE